MNKNENKYLSEKPANIHDEGPIQVMESGKSTVIVLSKISWRRPKIITSRYLLLSHAQCMLQKTKMKDFNNSSKTSPI